MNNCHGGCGCRGEGWWGGNLQEIPMENGPPAHPPIQNSLKSWDGSHLWDRTCLGVPEQIPQEIWYGKTHFASQDWVAVSISCSGFESGFIG